MGVNSKSESNLYLIVDDEDEFRERLVRALERRGNSVISASGHREALRIAEEMKPSRAIIDLKMPGKSGLELLSDLVKLLPETKVVVLTGYGSIATTQDAFKRGAFGYLTKPCQVDQLLAAFQDLPIDSNGADASIPLPSLAQVEWEYINRIIQSCGGNITHAAKAMGINRRSLQRRLAKVPDLK